MRQPVSVTVTCWVIIAFAIEAAVGLLSGIGEASLNEMLSSTSASISLSSAVVFGVIYSAATIAFAAFMLAGKNWARIVYLAVSALMLLCQFVPQPLQVAALAISGVKLIIFGVLLLRPTSNEYFSQVPRAAAQPTVQADGPAFGGPAA